MYESFIQGIYFSLEKGIIALIVEGDSSLVIRQLKLVYSCNDKRFLSYRKRVWDLKDDFEALNINSIPRRKNMVENALTISANTLQLFERTKLRILSVELVVAPSILDNIKNFQVFQDDQHILKFIMCSHHFSGIRY